MRNWVNSELNEFAFIYKIYENMKTFSSILPYLDDLFPNKCGKYENLLAKLEI